ncbi:MAG: GNAT family N-acetyltransferase [Bacteroidota bacterium]
MNFRLALIDELDTLNKISIQSKSYWGYPTSWIEHWKEDLTISPEQFQQQTILVVEEDDQIMGFSSITENEEYYEIHHLWLLPECIGKGIGKQLLHETLRIFIKASKPIVVTADPNAEPFYQSQGFVTFKKVESFPKGRYLPVMKKMI